MLRRILIAGAIGLFAAGLGSPASAQNTPVFFEPYGEIFSGRTLLRSDRDARPGDARYNQASKTADPRQRVVLQGGVIDTNDAMLAGAGLGYANTRDGRFPWSLSIFGADLDVDNAEGSSFVDATAKIGLWQSPRRNHPAASLVVNYQDVDNLGDFFRVVLALDQRISNELFLTGNVGHAKVDSPFVDESGLFAGVGATWSPRRWPRLSFSANYNLDTDTSGEDTYTISAIWAIDRTSSLQVGGGKHDKWLVNYRAKIDLK